MNDRQCVSKRFARASLRRQERRVTLDQVRYGHVLNRGRCGDLHRVREYMDNLMHQTELGEGQLFAKVFIQFDLPMDHYMATGNAKK